MHIRRIAVTLAAALLAISAGAQPDALSRDFGFVVGSSPYLTLSNPSLAGRMDFDHISVASLSFLKENGALKPLQDSPDCFTGDVNTESFVRISDKMAFHGKLSYSYFRGKDMSGQILIDSENSPFNFLESTEENVGIKTFESCNLIGGMAYSFNDSWSAGLSVDYRSGDKVKTKDPRFINKLMDLDIILGTAFTPSDSFSAGISLEFRDRVETLKGKIFGTTDQQYFVYTDKGGFWGVMEQLDGDFNYVSDATLNPMADYYYGGALQLVFGKRVKFSNELSFRYRTGTYGRKTAPLVDFFIYNGPEASYTGKLLIPSGNNLHQIDIYGEFDKLANSENVFKYITPAGRSTTVEIYGTNAILDRTDIKASAGYTFNHKVTEGRPASQLGVRADYFSRSQKTTVHPFYRNSSLTRIDATLFGVKNFYSGMNLFTISAAASYHTGFGVAKADGSYSEGATSSMKSFDDYLFKQFEYDTTSRVSGSLGFTYARALNDRFALSIGLKDTFSSMLSKPQYLAGRTRNAALISIGLTF
jgi:hypothetical protein